MIYLLALGLAVFAVTAAFILFVLLDCARNPTPVYQLDDDELIKYHATREYNETVDRR